METKGITCKIPLELHQQAGAMLAHPFRDHCLGGGRELFCPRCGCSRFTTRDKLGDAGTGNDGQPVHRDGHP